MKTLDVKDNGRPQKNGEKMTLRISEGADEIFEFSFAARKFSIEKLNLYSTAAKLNLDISVLQHGSSVF